MESRSGRLPNSEPAPDKDMKKNRLFNAALIFVAFALTCGFVASGAHFRAEEGIRGVTVGAPSADTILAPRDILHPGATEAARLAAQSFAQAQPATVVYDPNVWPAVEASLNGLANSMNYIRAFHTQEVADFDQAVQNAAIEFQNAQAAFNIDHAAWRTERDQLLAIGDDLSDLSDEPEEPVEPEPLEPNFQAIEMFDQLPIPITEAQRAFILSLDDYAYTQMWEIIMEAAYEVQSTVIREVDTTVLRRYLDDIALDRETRETIVDIVAVHLEVNHVVDEIATQNMRDNMAANYLPVYVQQDEAIVRIGEIVTEDMYEMLAQLGMLTDATIRDMVLPIAGAIFIVAMLFFVSLMYVTYYRPTMVSIKREAFLLVTLYVLTLCFVFALSDFEYPFIPVLIFPMLVSVLIERRSAVVLSFAMTLISYFIVAANWDFLMFFLVSGFVIAMLSRFTTDRNKIFLVGIVVMGIQFALSVAIVVITEHEQAFYSIPGLLTTAGIAAFNGLLTVIISTGSLPIWETFFGVVTPVKLLDLTNPTNLLLRRLTIEAPGTYHHSLIVANLAESAAYDIGANAHAARVGGYYHDVGKLKHPQYFAENLDGSNPHDHLDPADSARLIISHVSYGLELATEHRLPQFVRDIIQEHHGSSLLQFFYHKAMEAETQVDEKDYRYPYMIPQTRESACVMLADAVEAAIRSMMSKLKSSDEMESTIRGLIQNILGDGRLADSQLSIRDVAVIEQSFVRVLKGMYHERISYPKLIPVEDAEPVISAGEI